MIERSVLLDGAAADVPRILFCRLATITSWTVRDLSAPFWRCYLPLEPGGAVHWRGETFDLRPGHALLIAPGTAFATTLRRPFRKAYLHFTWDAGHRPGVTTHPVPSRRLHALRTISATGDGSALVLHLLAQALDGLVPQRNAEASQTEHSALVQEILLILQQRLQDPPTNAELGRRFRLHPNSLVRRFRDEVGMPPQRYLRDLRLDAVAQALAADERSIADLAEDFAFVDRHHLARAFTRRWGCPPGEFRRRNRDQG